jgi:hypothetical protein
MATRRAHRSPGLSRFARRIFLAGLDLRLEDVLLGGSGQVVNSLNAHGGL